MRLRASLQSLAGQVEMSSVRSAWTSTLLELDIADVFAARHALDGDGHPGSNLEAVLWH